MQIIDHGTQFSLKCIYILRTKYLGTKVPRSRVSRSHNASAKHTDSLYSFMEEHPADQMPEAQTDDNEKKKKLIDCAK